MTGRARHHEDDGLPPAPEIRVDGRDGTGAREDVVRFGGPGGPVGRGRVLLALAAALAVAAGAVAWWSARDTADDRLTAGLEDGARLVVDAGRDPAAGSEAEVRIEVAGRQRCQNVVRLELTGRPLCGAGTAVAVLAPAGCRVRFEPTSGPPVEAVRVRVPGSGLAVAAAVVDARTVTPTVRAVVVDDRGGRQLVTDVARRVAAGGDVADVAPC